MELETWEKEAFKELSKLYNNFLKSYQNLVKNVLELMHTKYFQKM